MNIDSLRAFCLSLPHTTEKLQWGDHLLFCVGGKMYAVVSLEPSEYVISFKSSAERSAELVENEGIDPAPYLARAQWVAVRSLDLLRDTEWRELLTEARRLVYEKLPKKMRSELEGSVVARSAPKKRGKTPGR